MERFGAIPLSDRRTRFVAWAPAVSELSLALLSKERVLIPMIRKEGGFFEVEADASTGARYTFHFQDGRELPDPASRSQPDGVHRPSEVFDTRRFRWTDSHFNAHRLSEMLIYELHIGTFTQTGTFAGAIPRLKELARLGITTVEIMPVAEFPGSRNWGYDGVYPFAAQSSYGGPAGLQEFVNSAHSAGISVILDVVYNHLGPEGNYLGSYGPFFTDRYKTPWGEAINYDGAESGPVREFFIQNALYWLEQFHIDGLRLDAVHGIFDFGAHHYLAELKERVAGLESRSGRRLLVIAESDLNDARLLDCRQKDGYALDAQWSDDFHHSLHTLLTGEKNGYYADFGSLEDLQIVLRDGWRFSGGYSAYRKRHHGNSPRELSPEHFVVCSQNHDQIGNRAQGDRLTQLVDFESLKLAAGVTLLSPFVPLLFMGEEYGETRPFQYFTSHGDAALIEAVRKGRRDEFVAFGWQRDLPDPQDAATFRNCVLDHSKRDVEPHRTLWVFYQILIAVRKRFRLGNRRPEVAYDDSHNIVTLMYGEGGRPLCAIFHFGQVFERIPLPPALRSFSLILNSATLTFDDGCPTGAPALEENDFLLGPRSFVLFESGEISPRES
jgi:maltooligosyltrehalose trehalohydrolase